MSNIKQKSENMIQGLEDRFSPRLSDIALASKLRMIADAFPDLPSTRGLQSERWWVRWHEDKDVGGTISNFVDSLHWADNDLYPNVRMILFISAFRPYTTASN